MKSGIHWRNLGVMSVFSWYSCLLCVQAVKWLWGSSHKTILMLLVTKGERVNGRQSIKKQGWLLPWGQTVPIPYFHACLFSRAEMLLNTLRKPPAWFPTIFQMTWLPVKIHLSGYCYLMTQPPSIEVELCFFSGWNNHFWELFWRVLRQRFFFEI